MHIYSLKIKQRSPKTVKYTYQTFNSPPPPAYLPYDRIYLIPAEHQELTKKLFRYCMLVDVDQNVKNILSRITLDLYREIGQTRNEKELEWRPPEKLLISTILSENTPWLMAVPTYLAREPLTGRKSLGYLLSDTIHVFRRINCPLLHVRLQTPTVTTSVICALCTEITSYYSNKCSPGQLSCALLANFSGIPDEELLKETVNQNTKETIECLDIPIPD